MELGRQPRLVMKTQRGAEAERDGGTFFFYGLEVSEYQFIG